MGKKKSPRNGALNSITTCISTTMVLILLGTVVFFVCAAYNFGHSVRENFTVEVLLDDSITHAQLQQLKGELQAMPYTREVNYISKEAGTREFMADIGGSPDDFIGGSPIPAEYEVFLKAEYACPDSLARYMPVLQKHDYVKDVVYPLDLMDAMDKALRTISIILLSVAGLLAFVSFSLINNTVRLGIHSRRLSIQTMKLVGAKWSFIRRPFMLRSLWIALVSALLAGGTLGGGMVALTRMNGNDEFDIVTPEIIILTLGCILACSLLLTLLCTYMSVNKHLHTKTGDSYLK